MKIDTECKTAIITGGTSGIGLATAKIFLDNNINCVIVGRSRKKGQAALEKLNIKFRMSEKTVGGANFIVRVEKTKMLVSVTKSSMKLLKFLIRLIFS